MGYKYLWDPNLYHSPYVYIYIYMLQTMIIIIESRNILNTFPIFFRNCLSDFFCWLSPNKPRRTLSACFVGFLLGECPSSHGCSERDVEPTQETEPMSFFFLGDESPGKLWQNYGKFLGTLYF